MDEATYQIFKEFQSVKDRKKKPLPLNKIFIKNRKKCPKGHKICKCGLNKKTK